MSTCFIICNNRGQFLSKQQEWIDGSEANQVFVAKFKDQAVNSLVEVNSRDIEMRCKVIEAQTDDRGRPAIADIGDISFTPIATAEAEDLADNESEDGARSRAQAAVENSEDAPA